MNSRKRRVGAIVKSFSEDVQRSFSRDGLNILLVRMAIRNSCFLKPETKAGVRGQCVTWDNVTLQVPVSCESKRAVRIHQIRADSRASLWTWRQRWPLMAAGVLHSSHGPPQWEKPVCCSTPHRSVKSGFSESRTDARVSTDLLWSRG